MDNCGIFQVSLLSPNDTQFDCVIVLLLTVGGTGIPLLLIILVLLCVLCCVCRIYRKRSRALDITQVEKKGSKPATSPGPSRNECGFQLKELTSVEDATDVLYDSVDQSNHFQKGQADTTKVEINLSMPSTDHSVPVDEPSPYEDVVKLEQPLYATPEKKPKSNGETKKQHLSAENAQAKRTSMPLFTEAPKENYSKLFDNGQTDSLNRLSLSLLPEGMYSSVGDLAPAPPLPPPLAEEDVPEMQSTEKLVSTDVKKRELESVSSLDMTEQDNPLYTNVAHKHRVVCRSADKLQNESERFYYNTVSREDLNSQYSGSEGLNSPPADEEQEPGKELYMNI